MKPRHQVSRAAVDLIKRFEGYRMKAAQLPDGRWTIGYGHTLTARQGAQVSEQDAEALLLYDLISVAHTVNELSYTPLTQNQFDALTCFAFNLGIEEFRHSDVLRRINEGALLQAACSMEMWRKADFEGERIVIDALVRRRSAEKALFLTPPDGAWVPAPSPLLQPRLDYDVSYLVPRQSPAELIPDLTGPRMVAARVDTPAVVIDAPAPSASEQAAAAVGAQLEAILAEDHTPAALLALAAPAPPTITQAEPDPEPIPEAVFEPISDVVLEPEPEPEPQLELELDAAAGRTHTPFQIGPEEALATGSATDRFEAARDEGLSFLRRTGDDRLDLTAPPMAGARFADAPAKGGGMVLLTCLGLLGLVLFGGGVVWILGIPATDIFSPVASLGWLSSVTGAVCFSAAAYRLLRQMGGPDAA